MLNINDFRYKQIIIANLRDGDQIKVSNNQLSIQDCQGNTKLTSIFNRLFVLYIIGNFTLTSTMIEKSKKYGFSIIVMSYSFRFITVINNGLEGNTLLRLKQYQTTTREIGKMIVINKLKSQKYIVSHCQSIKAKDLESNIDYYINVLYKMHNPEIAVIMAIEGLIAKQYFKVMFDSRWICYTKRMPRTKVDPINACLDIGYTILFSFVESVLSIYDFDLYVGVLHKQYHKRKSLVCDFVEPFRYIIDYETRKRWNLQVFKTTDFDYKNRGYYLKKEKNSLYTKVYMTVILENKEQIFKFIQSYYRWFMKNDGIEKFPEVCYNVDS